MMPLPKREATASGIGAGQTAVLDLPIGPTYHKLTLVVSDVDGAIPATVAGWNSAITGIRLKVNGREKWNLTAGQLFTINAYHGYSQASGMLDLNLTLDFLRTGQQETYLAYGTGEPGIRSFTLEVDFASGVVSPTMDIMSVTTDEPTKLGRHIEILQNSLSVAGSGEVEFTQFPRLDGGVIAVHVDSGDFDYVDVRQNNRTVFEGTPDYLKHLGENKGRWPRAWQPGYTHLDFMTRDRIDENLNLAAQDNRIRFTAQESAAGTRKLTVVRLVGVPA